MTDNGMRYRPLAHPEPDGRIAVYVGGAFQIIDLDAARRFREQLDEAIAQVFAMPAELVR